VNAFEPIGERARWRALVDEFARVDRGETITYERLGELLGLHPDGERHAISAAVRKASKALSREHDRSLVNVRNVGYRVALPDEHVDLAGDQQRRSGRALVRARAHVEHVDLSALTEEGRRITLAAASAIAWQQQQIRRLDLRQRDLERAVESVTTRQDRSDEQAAAWRAEIEAKIAALDKRDT